MLLIPSLISLFIVSEARLVDEWRAMDQELCVVLENSDREKWDSALDRVELYTQQLQNLTNQLAPDRVRRVWAEVVPVLKTGRPRFITVPVIGSVLKKSFNMTDLQIYRVWVVRNRAAQEYDRFIRRLTWMKENNFLGWARNETRATG